MTTARDLADNDRMSLPLTVTDAAAKTVLEGVSDPAQAALRITISPSFQYDLRLDAARADDVVVSVNGITILFDPASAERAPGLTLDFDNTGDGGFTIDNPNVPAPIAQITAPDLRALLDGDEPFELLDVRTPGERAIAMIEGSRLLDQAVHDELMQRDRNTPLVFQCHHGMRSQSAAEYFQRAGFKRLYNLQGGIEAWSLQVDPSVPRY
jgi:monothiol glutaredoxin